MLFVKEVNSCFHTAPSRYVQRTDFDLCVSKHHPGLNLPSCRKLSGLHVRHVQTQCSALPDSRVRDEVRVRRFAAVDVDDAYLLGGLCRGVASDHSVTKCDRLVDDDIFFEDVCAPVFPFTGNQFNVRVLVGVEAVQHTHSVCQAGPPDVHNSRV